MEDENVRIFRVAMIGPHSTGKTSLLNFFHFGSFDPSQASTIGANFISHSIKSGKDEIELQIWDTAGQDKYKSIGSHYYREACAVIAVFDLNEPETITGTDDFINDYLQCVVIEDPLVVVVGNKSDLVQPGSQGFVRGHKYSEDHKYPFFATSAKTGEGVNQVFDFISNTLIRSFNNANARTDDLKLSKKNGCCK